MKELRIPLFFAVFCFLISFLLSLFSGIGFLSLLLRASLFSLLGFIFLLFVIKFLLLLVPEFENVLFAVSNGDEESEFTDDEEIDAVNEDDDEDAAMLKKDTEVNDMSYHIQEERDREQDNETMEHQQLDRIISTQNEKLEYNSNSDNFDETRADIMLEGIKKEAIENKEKMAKSVSHFLKKE